MAWKDTAGKVYTDRTVISADTDLHAVFREKAHISPNGNIIATNDFKIHLNSVKKEYLIRQRQSSVPKQKRMMQTVRMSQTSFLWKD